MLKSTERPKTPGMSLKKNIAFPEGNKLLAGDFVLIWMKQMLIWLNLQRDGTRNGFSNIKETFAETRSHSKLKFTYLKDLFIKSVQKN